MIDYTLLKRHTFGLVAAEHVESLPQDVAHTTLSTGILQDSATLMPSLIELSQLSEAKSIELLELMNSQINDNEVPVVSTLISTDYDLKRMQSYFAKVQICSNVKGERAWLRVHDPRVWAQLERTLKPATFTKITKPIHTWTMYFGREWVSQNPKSTSAGHQTFANLQLDDQEWAALERIGIVNRSLQELNITGHKESLSHSTGLDELTVRAQRTYGLNSVDELVCYVCLGWNSHPMFDTHQIARDAIIKYQHQLKTGELDVNDSSAVNAFKDLTDSDWASIRKDLNLETNKTAGSNL